MERHFHTVMLRIDPPLNRLGPRHFVLTPQVFSTAYLVYGPVLLSPQHNNYTNLLSALLCSPECELGAIYRPQAVFPQEL